MGRGLPMTNIGGSLTPPITVAHIHMERPSTSKPRGTCKYYETPRGCFAGKRCKFLHGQDEKLTPYDKSKTCRYYQAGYCKHGERCWFLHIDRFEEPTPPGSDTECIICYEKPVTYGLMDGCSHVLCVQCIRQWRNPNNKTDDAETTNISCPYCRVPSYFVTPSSQFFPKDHPRRNEIVAQFKASMARVPCKHFQDSPPNRRRCPFGRHCFYQHLNPDGTTYTFPENTNPRRWMRSRDLDDLTVHLEMLRRSIPGNDASQTEQQMRFVDLALDFGRTLNRFGFGRSEDFSPLELLLFVHGMAGTDEEQHIAAEEAAGDGQPPQEIADAILGTAREAPRRASADVSVEGSETGGASGGTPAGGPGTTDPAPRPSDASIRVNFTPGNLLFTVESTLDLASAGEGSNGTREDRSPTANALGDRGEVATSTQLERPPGGDASSRGEVLQPEDSAELVGSPEDSTTTTPSTPSHHDPHPPFETDGRGRVVWSNSSQQLRSRSSPPVSFRKFGNDETNVVKDKESERATDVGVCSNSGGNGDVGRSGEDVETGGPAAGVP